MNRMGRGSYAWMALAGMVGVAILPAAFSIGNFAGSCQTGDRDPLGHLCVSVLPPPDLCRLCPLIDESIAERCARSEPDALASDDGHRLPLASRAPPVQA